MRFEIRKMIAESGKMRVNEAVAYVMHRMPDADKKMVKKLRVQIRSLFENDSNIIKALGGSTPINYYGWDKSISARVKWVNGSIDRWAQAMKQAAQ